MKKLIPIFLISTMLCACSNTNQTEVTIRPNFSNAPSINNHDNHVHSDFTPSINLKDKEQKVEEKQPEETKKQEPKKEEPKKEEKFEATCIYCNGPLKDSDKKSVCQNCVERIKQEQEQEQERELTFKCRWCGKTINEDQYDTWGGCCSEGCAVSAEGTAYENYERDELGMVPEKDENLYQGVVPDGGCTICGWCGARVMDDRAFCSNICEKAHKDYYNN